MSDQNPAPHQSFPPSLRNVLLTVTLIVLAVCGFLGALALFSSGSSGSTLSLQHTPPSAPLTVAQPITFTATVTGNGLSSVALSYRIIDQAPSGQGLAVGNMVSVSMLLQASGGSVYSYTLQPGTVSGPYIDYSISATDTSGHSVGTPIYALPVRDFAWHSDKTDVTVTRSLSSTVQLGLDPINGFNDSVTISVAGSLPLGLQVTPSKSRVNASSPVSITISSASDAQIVSGYAVEIDATYTSAAYATRVVRSTDLALTVTDFAISVAPSFVEINHADTARYALTMNIYKGFVAPSGFNFTVAGLPANAVWRLELVSLKIDQNGNTVITYNLVIDTQSNTPTGLKLISITVTALTPTGTVTDGVNNIQLKIN